MALGPVAMDEVKQVDTEEADKIERLIDTRILREWHPDEPTHAADAPRRRVAEELKRRYEAVGWRVTLAGPGPDGSFNLQFTVPPK